MSRRIPDKATALRCLWRMPRFIKFYEPDSPKLKEDIVDSIDLLENELTTLQSAHDKLKERVEGAPTGTMFKTISGYYVPAVITDKDVVKVALVKLTPEEMDGNQTP